VDGQLRQALTKHIETLYQGVGDYQMDPRRTFDPTVVRLANLHTVRELLAEQRDLVSTCMEFFVENFSSTFAAALGHYPNAEYVHMAKMTTLMMMADDLEAHV
jgi:hypothetical protein